MFLFLFFLKFFTFVFFILSLLSLIPLIMNMRGSGLKRNSFLFVWMKTSLGNLDEITEENQEWMLKLFYTQIFIDFLMTLLLLVSIYVFKFICKLLQIDIKEKTINISDYSLRFEGFPRKNISKMEIISFLNKLAENQVIKIAFAY